MSDDMNIYMLEMMASKICHDLISPIGAINNGLEILDELGADGSDEVVGLIAFSAQQASAKLKAFRLAYGAGGGESHLKADDAFQAIQSIVETEGKIVQKWNPHATLAPGEEKPRGFCKILTATLLLAIECLPKGGEIVAAGASGSEFSVSATGENAKLRPECDNALMMKTPALSLEPQSVHAALCGIIARSYGFSVRAEKTADDCIRFYVVHQ